MELISLRGLHHVNPYVCNELYPIPKRINNSYVLFSFSIPLSSVEVVQKIEEKNCLPANSHELLWWYGWNEHDSVAAMGSEVKIHGSREVLLLHGSGNGWRLILRCIERQWDAGTHFLAVQKENKLSLRYT